jgi:hypothetical protein
VPPASQPTHLASRRDEVTHHLVVTMTTTRWPPTERQSAMLPTADLAISQARFSKEGTHDREADGSAVRCEREQVFLGDSQRTLRFKMGNPVANLTSPETPITHQLTQG